MKRNSPLAGFSAADLHAETCLHGAEYVVRPHGSLGTCGFYPRAWEAVFVRARTPAEAIRKAMLVKYS